MVSPETGPLQPANAPPPMAAPEVDLAFQLEAEPVVSAAAMADAPSLISGEAAEALWNTILRQWLAALAHELPPSLRAPAYSLGLSLVDDSTMSEYNRTWRQQSGPTDVLAFAAQEEAPPLPVASGGEGPPIPLELGDIVISLETAARQAAETDQALGPELLFLASHGLLHLLGWDHPDEPSLAAMLARQDNLLSSTLPLT